MNDRLIKILLSLTVGSYISLVCFNNITDYASNFQFVHMVAKMEDTFSFSTNSWRSIQNTGLHHALYVVIIGWELAIAGCLIFGAYKMFKALKSPNAEFKEAKKFTGLGFALGIILWFFVFITVGGEWFLMWQSTKWNAQSNAFFLTCCFLLFLIHHNQENN